MSTVHILMIIGYVLAALILVAAFWARHTAEDADDQ